MTEPEFLKQADATLSAIEDAAEHLADALDIEISRSGNVLTLELADASKIIVNSQTPMRELWVAARSGGYHYAWLDGAWRNTRDGTELFSALSELLTQQSGAQVTLQSP